MANLSLKLRGRGIRIAIFIVWFACSSVPAPAQSKDETKPPAPSAENQAPFKLKVRSNLVVLRVVVRNAQGKPVEGLRKEDFKLFDRGKEQTIQQFDVETSTPGSSLPAVHTPGQTAPPPALPGKFLALYFDDLNTSDTDMMQSRDAADHYLAASLHPKDRVAIFTSAKVLSDFTADPKQIHDALSKLRASPRALNRIHDCPDLSDYQAAQIEHFQDDPEIDAWKMALDEMAHNPTCPKVEDPKAYVVMQARNIVAQAQILARTSLQELERMVQYMSQMPGRRIIIMVSPGFLSESEQYQLDRIIDRALRSDVVISSLDPKGLAMLMRESDITRSYTPAANSGVVGAMHDVDSAREFSAGDVLVELAQGTGGEFFHNNNDLKAGFGALAGSPTYYVLAYAPSDTKADGKFHALKVTLAEKEKGVTIQARRGYFSPKNEAEAEADARQQATSDAEAQAREQIREAMLSQDDLQQLPVVLGAKLSPGKDDKRELYLVAHLDAATLHFHKEGNHNLNTLTFVFAIFDQKDKLVDSQERRARVNLPDAQLPDLLKSGVDADMTFQLGPGIYRIREVVTDSEEHHMTAFSKNVKIP